MKKVFRKYDLIFVSPHLDDAVLSCGGLICKSINDNKKVLVVTVFTKSDKNNQVEFKKRINEDMEALNVLGCNGLNLNFLEGSFRYKKCDYKSLLNKNELYENLLIKKIGKEINKLIKLKLKPEGCLYFPMSVGGHIDHKIIRKIGENIKEKYKISFWEDFPYCLYIRPPNCLFDLQKKFVLNEIINILDFVEYKKNGIECYKTQIKLLFRRKPMFLSTRENYYKAIDKDKKILANKIVYMTDELSGGARIANDYILSEIVKLVDLSSIRIYEQVPPVSKKTLAGTKIVFWSILNYFYFLKNCVNAKCIITTSPHAVVACFFLKKFKQLDCELIYYINGDRSFYSPLIKKTKGLFKFTYHKLYCLLYKTMEQLTCSAVDKFVVASSEFKKSLIKKHKYRIPQSKVQVIKSGVDTNLFFEIDTPTKRRMREDMQIDKNSKVIMFSGRIDPLKGIDQLIDSLGLLNTKEKVTLLLITPIPETCMNIFYKNLVYKIKCSKYDVRLNHPKNRIEIANYYKISDFVVLPSIIENSPLVMFEAIACGCIFVGYGVGEVLLFLRQIDSSLVIRHLNPLEIANKINWLLSLPHKDILKIRKSGTSLMANMTWEKTGKELISLTI